MGHGSRQPGLPIVSIIRTLRVGYRRFPAGFPALILCPPAASRYFAYRTYFALHHVALMAVQQGRPPGFSMGPGNPLMASRSFDKLRMSRGLRRSFCKIRVSGDFCKISGQPWWRLWVTLRLPAVISARACSHKTCCRFPYYVILNGQNCHSERSEESKMVRVRNVSYSKDFRPFAPLRVTLHWE